MRIKLFGVGIKDDTPMITAQQRINCYVEAQREEDRTRMALIGTPGLSSFSTGGAFPSRGLWAVDSLATPLIFSVHAGTLKSINNAGVTADIGTIGTTSGNVSMADDGTNLVLVDGAKGYYYDMVSPGSLTEITAGNFATDPSSVTWQNQKFIVNDDADNSFQLSDNNAPATWPAANINNFGSGAGSINQVIVDHSILNLFTDKNAEFWQDAGTPGFPYSRIPGSAQEFGLAAPFSLAKYDNSLAGLFQNRMGEANISRLRGFSLDKLSDHEVDGILNGFRIDGTTIADAQGYAYTLNGHPMYVIGFPTAGRTLMYDDSQRAWSELQNTSGGRHWGAKFCNFLTQRIVSDYRNGSIYKINPNTYTDNGSLIPMEVTSKHIWQDDKYIGIQQIQIDVQAGVGLATGQGSDPQIMLYVSKDGGSSFREVSWQSVGKIGEYTQRVVWRTLGAARDWVLRLRITDPVKRVIVGASAEITGASF